jgi:hypothetical protein
VKFTFLGKTLELRRFFFTTEGSCFLLSGILVMVSILSHFIHSCHRLSVLINVVNW